jgi:hypothetical protein
MLKVQMTFVGQNRFRELHGIYLKEKSMIKNVAKKMAAVLMAALLVSGVPLLAGCSQAKSGAETSAYVFEGTGAGTVTPAAGETTASTTAAPLEILPSVATKTVTINGSTVSAAEYDFFYYLVYQNYSSYVSYGYMPTTAEGKFDLTAACTFSGYEDKTWGEYIIDSAEIQMQDVYILSSLAETAGTQLSTKNQDAIDSFYTSLASSAASYSMSADDYLKSMYGEKMTQDLFKPIITRYLLANQYMTDLESGYTFTDEELNAYHEENPGSYTGADLPIVRHILFLAPKGVSGYTDATEQELTDAKAKADAALAQITSLDTMVSVGDAALADGSAVEATQYTVAKGQMVTEFENWCYDASRKAGDKAVVQTEYGYHVMYFIGTEKDWKADAVSALTDTKYADYIKSQEALPQFAIVKS